jgi:sugar phosphate isomerase/epimerase
MRLAGHTLGTREQTVSEALELFAAAGLVGAEVIYQDGYPSGLPLRDRRSAEEARQASEDLRVPIVGITPYTTGINALDEGQCVLSLEYEYRWHAEDLPQPVVGFARSAEALRACLALVSVAGSAR